MRAAVIVFPGSNCDRDAAVALKRVTGKPALMVWHKETELPKLDLVVVPGGFSYGDYLRSGAMAARAPVMREVARRANEGVPVLGICNGFQILTEAGLLPGALMRNASLSFVHKLTTLEVASTSTMFTVLMAKGDRLVMPIAHGEGNYFADPATLDRLEGEGRVVFRYTDNPNGSARNIAGIVSERGNVMGLMPHPERACDPATGLLDGRRVFESIMSAQPGARAGAA